MIALKNIGLSIARSGLTVIKIIPWCKIFNIMKKHMGDIRVLKALYEKSVGQASVSHQRRCWSSSSSTWISLLRPFDTIYSVSSHQWNSGCMPQGRAEQAADSEKRRWDRLCV